MENSNEKVVAAPVGQTEQVKSDPLSKGKERLSAIGSFFTKAKDRIVNNKVTGAISRFWNKTKSASVNVAATVMQPDVYAEKAGQKIDKAMEEMDKEGPVGKWINEKGEKVQQAFDKGVTGSIEGIKSAGSGVYGKMEQFANFVDNAVDKTGIYDLAGEAFEKTKGKVKGFFSWTSKMYEKGSNFLKTKKDQVVAFAKDKIELAKLTGAYAMEKTSENLGKAKEGIKNRYNNMAEYGRDAIASAKIRAGELKDAWNGTGNSARIKMMEMEMSSLSGEEAAVAERAQELRDYKDKLRERMDLLKGVKVEQAEPVSAVA